MKYTLKFRVWHWLNAFIVLGLLGTIFLRETFLNAKINSEIILSKLSEFSIIITDKQAISLAKTIRAEMWQWHIYLGYALALLVLYRIYLYFRDDSHHEKFSELTLHKKMVKAFYYFFYISLLYMSISGLVIYFHDELNISKGLAHNLKELHEVIYYVILIFVPIHIFGVIIADNTSDKGIVSTMINGKKAN